MISRFEARRLSYSQVREALFANFHARRPGSLIRIGDGESVILSYKPDSPSEDLSSHLRLWFGNSIPNPKQLLRLREKLRRACRSAFVLGVPTLRQCGVHSRYQVSYQSLEQLLKRRPNVFITDAAVHRFLHLSGDLLACLRGSPFIGVVSSQPISGLVSRYFMPDELFVKRVPGEHSIDLTEPSSSSMEWMDQYGFLKDFRVSPPYRGAPYLVGAGLMGKLICDQIRRSGGFAIDVGSIFDGWVENSSRSYFDNYSPRTYRLDHALDLIDLDSEQRFEHFLELVSANEVFPQSFYFQ